MNIFLPVFVQLNLFQSFASTCENLDLIYLLSFTFVFSIFFYFCTGMILVQGIDDIFQYYFVGRALNGMGRRGVHRIYVSSMSAAVHMYTFAYFCGTYMYRGHLFYSLLPSFCTASTFLWSSWYSCPSTFLLGRWDLLEVHILLLLLYLFFSFCCTCCTVGDSIRHLRHLPLYTYMAT